MSYLFRLEVGREKSELALVADGTVKARETWQEGRDMGRRLFSGIEALLHKNALAPEEISDFQIVSALPPNSTSLRIAQTIQKAYTFSVTCLLTGSQEQESETEMAIIKE